MTTQPTLFDVADQSFELVPTCAWCGASGPGIPVEGGAGARWHEASQWAWLALKDHEPRCPKRVVTVHCFFHFCPHIVNAATPGAAHDEMEQHYKDRHASLIARLAGCIA
jgi:hypothetical protein